MQVLAEEAAYMDVSSFTSQTADGAARSEVGAKDVGQSESPQHTGAQDSAGLQQIASQPPRASFFLLDALFQLSSVVCIE